MAEFLVILDHADWWTGDRAAVERAAASQAADPSGQEDGGGSPEHSASASSRSLAHMGISLVSQGYDDKGARAELL